jgi:hypothetical protein
MTDDRMTDDRGDYAVKQAQRIRSTFSITTTTISETRLLDKTNNNTGRPDGDQEGFPPAYLQVHPLVLVGTSVSTLNAVILYYGYTWKRLWLQP